MICMYIYIYVYIHTCMFTYIYIYIYMLEHEPQNGGKAMDRKQQRIPEEAKGVPRNGGRE